MKSTNPFEELTALDSLFQTSAKYRISKNFIELLDFINRFPKLSPFNAFLIHMQNSGVELVLSQSKWREYNREVKFNARPMVILVPFGPVEFVFDIADTEGDEIPEYLRSPFYTLGFLDQFTFSTLIRNLSKEGIHYREKEMHKDAAGYAERSKLDEFCITINFNMDLETKFSTIIHELAHILCGHLGLKLGYKWPNRNGLSEEIRELEAESISYLVCRRLGLKTSSHTYLSQYLNNRTNESLPNISFDLILTVSNQIEQMTRIPYKIKLKDPYYKGI